MTHYLKTWPVFFKAVWDLKKTFELRKNDRNFKVGDRLQLQEYDPTTKTYSGRFSVVNVTYVLNANQVDGLDPDYCIIGFHLYANLGGDEKDM